MADQARGAALAAPATDSPPPTLAVHIYEALSHDNAPWEDLCTLAELPREAWGPSHDEEDRPDSGDLLSWGFYYGAAYAAARIFNPLRGEDWWKAEARSAADKVSRWHATVGGRPGGEC